MKTKRFKIAAFAVLYVVGLAACNSKEDPKTPAPVITKITTVDDTSAEISEAALNQSIAIFGENFVDVQEISINNIGIDVREAYITETRIDVVVPRQIPAEVNDKLVIVTLTGRVEKTLVVNLPKLVINGFKNDFAADGDEVEVTGENFDLYKIDKENATLTFNGAPIEMKASTDKSFTIVVPEGTPWPSIPANWQSGEYSKTNVLKDYGQPSYLTIASPEIKGEIRVPFRDQGISILTNDPDTWWSGWWPTGIVETPFTGEIVEGITPYFRWVGKIKMTTSNAWQYENVTFIHWWLPEPAADIENNPDDWCVKMEVLNPSTTPFAKYIRIGDALVESNDNEHFYMWDPAATNEGVSFNTMGKWQTVTFEVKDLFSPLADGKNTSLVFSNNPANTFDDQNQFKIAMQREEPGDVEFYYWNVRFVKKLKYTY